MSVTLEEIESQPSVWRQAAETALDVAPRLPPAGRRIAIVGCGTSYYIAQSVAVARESAGQGESDAFVASEMPTTRTYDAVLAISRSGTTTEVVRALKALPAGTPSLAISAVPLSPVVEAASDAILLPFADEESIVQTRFATATLALMRAALGHDLAPAIETAEASLAAPLPVDPAEFEHFVFLGHGWTVGLAFEAALKFRETSGAWAEAYPGDGVPPRADQRRRPEYAGVVPWRSPRLTLPRRSACTGATVAGSGADPMAELVTLQRMAVALAQSRGLDPDRPQHLTRSVVLP